MSKIDLVPITGAQQLSAINDNFKKVGDALNDKVLYRDNPTGEPNQVVTDVDMNGKRIYNLPQPQSPSEPVRYQDLGDVTALTDEARGYAEAAATSAQLASDNATLAAGHAGNASNSATLAQQAVLDAQAQAALAAASATESAGHATSSANSAIDAANSAAEAASKVAKTSDNGSAVIPAGTDAQRDADGTPSGGWAHYSSERNRLEVFNGTSWVSTGDPDAIAALEADVENLDQRVTTLENASATSAYVYFGGSEASPVSLALNSQLLQANPFPGSRVGVRLEFKSGIEWIEPGFYTNNTGAYGAAARHKYSTDMIYVISSQTGTMPRANIGCNLSGNGADTTAPLPVRVLVWKV